MRRPQTPHVKNMAEKIENDMDSALLMVRVVKARMASQLRQKTISCGFARQVARKRLNALKVRLPIDLLD